jgi:hypothetical protein
MPNTAEDVAKEAGGAAEAEESAAFAGVKPERVDEAHGVVPDVRVHIGVQTPREAEWILGDEPADGGAVGGEPFTLTPDPGIYALEWFGVDDRETAGADQPTVTEGSAQFTPPFSEGPAVLYLKKVPVTSA